MKLNVLNSEGQNVSSFKLSEELTNTEMNDHILHFAVKVYQANRRQGTHATKTRAFVSGGGKKPFKQKGTGNARQGSTRSPLNPGGAVLHGPQPRDYRQGLNQKSKKLALRVALSDKVRNEAICIVDDFKITEYSTKNVLGMLKKLGFENKKVLIADHDGQDFLYKSARNIHKVKVKPVSLVNAEDLLRGEVLLVTPQGLTSLEARSMLEIATPTTGAQPS